MHSSNGGTECQMTEIERSISSPFPAKESSCTAQEIVSVTHHGGDLSATGPTLRGEDNEAGETIEKDTASSAQKQKTTATKRNRALNEPQRTISYFSSLPVADATPEAVPSEESVVAVATDVVAVGVVESDGNDIQSRHIAASLISVRFYKATRDVRLGLSFRSVDDGQLEIFRISPNGPLADSPLRPGNRVLSFGNDRTCGNWTVSEAVAYLRDKVGFINIVAGNSKGDPNVAEAAVYKTRKDDKLGISFRNDDNGSLRIKIINVSGLLGGMSVLHVGDNVESINHVPCSEIDSHTALYIVRDIPDLVTIIVKNTYTIEVSIRDIEASLSARSLETFLNTPHTITASEVSMLDLEASYENLVEPRFVSVMVSKPKRETELGISLGNLEEGDLEITTVTDSGLLSTSPLKAGFKILSINHKQCKDWGKQYAETFLRSAEEKVLIFAQNLDGKPYYVQAMACKSSPSATIGVQFKCSSRGPLKIGTVSPDNIFGNSVLNSGDEVIAINNTPCHHMTPSEAAAIVKSATKTVTILSKTQSCTGLVFSHSSDPLKNWRLHPAAPQPIPSSNPLMDISLDRLIGNLGVVLGSR